MSFYNSAGEELKSLFSETLPSSGDKLLDQATQMAIDAETGGNALTWQNGHVISPADAQKMAYDRALELDDRAYKAERWEIESSVQGMVNQYKEAGMNPILATGIQPQSGASSSPASSSLDATGGGDVLGGALGMIGQLLGFATDVSGAVNTARSTSQEIKESQARERNYDVDTETKRLENTKRDIELLFYNRKNELDLIKDEKQIEAYNASIKKTLSDIDVNQSVINVNGSQVQLNSAKEQREVVLTSLNSLDVQKSRALLPYATKVVEADLSLKDSQTKLNEQNTLLSYQNTCLSFAERSIKEGLIDNDYAKHYVDQIKNNADLLGKEVANYETVLALKARGLTVQQWQTALNFIGDLARTGALLVTGGMSSNGMQQLDPVSVDSGGVPNTPGFPMN